MTYLTIEMYGDKKIHRGLRKLVNEGFSHMNFNITKSGSRLVRDEAKRYAPKWKGYLRRSIKSKKMRKTKYEQSYKVVVKSPYGWYQDKGYRPHFIHMFQSTKSGHRVYEWMQTHGYNTYGPGGHIRVKKYTPFMTPALQKARKKLPRVIRREVYNGMQRAFR